MTTVASPVSVREQVLGIIAEHICRPAQVQDVLGEIGCAVFADLLIDLEEHFDIGLDVDELMPNGTVGVLVGLVEIRAKAQGAGRRVYYWDDERARRALPLVRPPTRSDEAIFDERFEAPQRPELPHGACAACGRATTLNAGGVCIACFCDDAAQVRPTPAYVAAPSDAAWAQAGAIYAQERERRFYLLVIALVTTTGGLCCGLAWAFGAGLL